MRAALLSGLISIAIFSSQVAQAASQLDAATLKQLTLLEQKFFGHTFNAESDEDRTQRIEKQVFGTTSEGAAGERIKKLASVTYLDTRPEPEPVQSQPKKVETSQQERLPIADPIPAPAPPRKVVTQPVVKPVVEEPDIPPAKPGSDDYPHVTALEKEILGSTYVGQVLTARIQRMETKAFGSPSKSADLGERTDNLDQYAEQKLHKKPFLSDDSADSVSADGTTTGTDTTQSGYQSQSQPQSDYPHVTALETAILGQPRPDQPLEKRLAAMEVKAFGGVSNSAALSDRTDALEKFAEKTLHKKPFGQDVNYETADGSGDQTKATGGKGKKLLSIVGNSLLGMAGVNGITGGALNGLAPPGMSPMTGYGGNGFSGIRVRKRQAEPPDPSDHDDGEGTPLEDPAVLAKDPPPTTARLAIRVAWCEMHVFGKTYNNMHLAERLTQLNRELNFDPGKSAFELMDGINALVKSAQAYKAPSPGTSPAPAIGAAPPRTAPARTSPVPTGSAPHPTNPTPAIGTAPRPAVH